MKCQACQSENPSDSRYCHRCGSAIEESDVETLSYSPIQKAAVRETLKFEPGEKFGDRYTIIEEIGRGGMGRVYKAEDHELGITVVLKMIRPELSSRPRMVELFRKETLLGRSISHENVVRIHDLGAVNGIKYISMDYIKGENLAELIQTSGSLALATCLQVAVQICRALRAAHEKGIIHRDLKPQNIMIDNSGKVFVTDFGLAESLAGPKTGPSGKIRGTPKYFSPEQARGEEPDQRSDIYSLGIILYEMATGKAPFKADTAEGYIREHTSEKPSPPSKANPSIPPACEKIILKCLEKKKENRYQTVEELLQDLEIQKKQGHHTGARPRMKIWQKDLLAAGMILLLGIIGLILKQIIWPPVPLRSERPTIAVMYAVNNSGDKSLNEKLRWGIPYYLGTDLAQSKYLSVLPQDRLMQVLLDMKQMDEEHHLSRTLDRIADAVPVQYFVLPSFTKVGDNLWISFMIRKAKSDEMLGEPDVVKGKIVEDLMAMVDELSLKVKSRLNFSPADIAGDYNQKLDQITTGSLEAVRYYVEAEKYYVRKDYKASIQVLEKAVREDPNFAIAYWKMADDYEYLGELDKQGIYLQKALTLLDHVSEKERLIIQGYASLVLNESPLKGIECYKKLIALDLKDQEGYLRLGAAWRNLEEWDLAMEQIEKTLTMNPENPLALENKVFIDTYLGRYNEAFDLSEANARASLVNKAFFLNQIPWLYLIQGQYDQASAGLERALSSTPDDLDLLELKGHLNYLKGDLTSARQIYEQLQNRGEATLDAPDLRGRLWLAHLHLLQGEYGQAQKGILEGIEFVRKANRTFDEPDFRLLLAYSELQLRRFAHVVEALKPALELWQKTMLTHSQKHALHLLGLASIGMGQIEDAKRISRQLRQLVERTCCPKHLRYYDHLMGQIALAEGHFDQAITYFEQAITLLPYQSYTDDEQALYYDGLAAAYYKRGDWPKAIKTYDRIIALTTGRLQWGDIYARSYYWLGKIHQRTGNSREAAMHYERFLQLWKNADIGLPEIADAQKQLEALRKAL